MSLCSVFFVVAASLQFSTAWPAPKPYKHVIAFSIDGMHSSDLGKFVALRPKSAIASLLATGHEYTDAYTSAPSDSFPGSIAQYTGGSPRTTGIWYDDSWVKNYYDPGSDCKGPPGAEVQYAENLDFNSSLLFSGGIDPSNLPMALVNGVCKSIYPHSHLRVNTAFEVVVAAGMQTAYTDKHPAYDIMRGPSGTGLTSGYFPEIASAANTVNATIAYDQTHVNAWLSWIDGMNVPNVEGSVSAFPALMGGNFQALSVAQKTVGYNKDLSFSTGIIAAMDFVDSSIGQVVAKLKAKGYYEDTLIIVASKHGQAPIDPSLWNEVDPDLIMNKTGVPTQFVTTDDIALVWLNNSADAAKAAANLNVNAASLKIQQTFSGSQLSAAGFGNPLTDVRVPDVIVQPKLGTCYTTSNAKIEEHGGISDDDRKVTCFVSSPRLQKKVIDDRVSTRQVAPTILRALGLDPHALKAVVAEGTEVLGEFCW